MTQCLVHRILGLGEAMMGVGRVEIRPTRVQGTKTSWVGWGPKRETRGAIGDPGVKIGGSTSQEMPGLGLGEEQMWGSTLCGVSALPFPLPEFRFPPTLTPWTSLKMAAIARSRGRGSTCC